MDTILTTSPEHVKLILSTDFNNYVKGMYIMSVYSASADRAQATVSNMACAAFSGSVISSLQ
jgi:hypothetical protein